MKSITCGLAAFLLVGLTSAFAEDKKDDAKTKIVGTWEVAKAEEITLPVGAIVEFKKDGKFTAKFEDNGNKVTVDGTYEIDGESLKSTAKTPDGEEHKITLKIKKLTDKALVLDDEQGKKVEFKKPERK